MRIGLRASLLGLVLLAALSTAIISLSPDLKFAANAPGLRIALETSAFLIASLAAFLILGRLPRSRRLDHTLVGWGLGGIAISSLLLAAGVVSGLRAWEDHSLSRAILLVGATALAAGAVAPARPASPRLHRRRLTALAVGSIGAVGTLVALLGLLGGPGTATSAPGGDPSTDPGVLVMRGWTAAAFAIAAVGFTRRARATADLWFDWLATAAALAALGRAHALFRPATEFTYVYVGDVFRLLAYLAVLGAAVHEIRRSWRELAHAAVSEERRRIAAEIHDVIAQQLAFIRRRAHRIRDRHDPVLAEEIGAAADRALRESRAAIRALAPRAPSAGGELDEALEGVAARLGARLIPEDPGARSRAIAKIAEEAVANAVRHGNARNILVELERGRTVRLRVVDDGQGFDPERPNARFGLRSMRHRARARGGDLRLRSRPGEGTEVDVDLP